MNTLQKRVLAVLIIGCMLCLAPLVFIMYIRESNSPPNGFELPQVTAAYTYVLPASVNIIEGKANVADIFGDFSMCASFTLSESDMQALRRQGLNWFPAVKKGYASESNWSTGTYTEAISGIYGHIGYMLDDKPDPKDTYSFIKEDVDGGWQRTVGIDENTKVIYYCRITW